MENERGKSQSGWERILKALKPHARVHKYGCNDSHSKLSKDVTYEKNYDKRSFELTIDLSITFWAHWLSAQWKN